MSQRELEMAPMRPLEDFILGGARFQAPPFNDLQRWANRVLANLLYYQTNYFIFIAICFFLVGLIHPKDVLLGFFSLTVAIGVFGYATSSNPQATQFKKEHPVVSLALIVAAIYFLVYVLGSVIVFLYGFALPMLVMFIHASVRMRNLKNKISQQLESVGFKKSPMAKILEAIGIEVELIQLSRND